MNIAHEAEILAITTLLRNDQQASTKILSKLNLFFPTSDVTKQPSKSCAALNN